MSVVNVPPLLLDLALPFCLLVAQPVDHVSTGSGCRASLPSHLLHGVSSSLTPLFTLTLPVLVLFIQVFPVPNAGSSGRVRHTRLQIPPPVVQDRVEALQEAHVNDQDRDDPNDHDDHHLHDGEAADLELAVASGTEHPGLGFG